MPVLPAIGTLSDFSFLVGDAGTKGHLFYSQLGEAKNASYEISLQNVRGDVTEEVKEEMRKVMKKVLTSNNSYTVH